MKNKNKTLLVTSGIIVATIFAVGFKTVAFDIGLPPGATKETITAIEETPDKSDDLLDRTELVGQSDISSSEVDSVEKDVAESGVLVEEERKKALEICRSVDRFDLSTRFFEIEEGYSFYVPESHTVPERECGEGGVADLSFSYRSINSPPDYRGYFKTESMFTMYDREYYDIENIHSDLNLSHSIKMGPWNVFYAGLSGGYYFQDDKYIFNFSDKSTRSKEDFDHVEESISTFR